jgi:hypothetical protein
LLLFFKKEDFFFEKRSKKLLLMEGPWSVLNGAGYVPRENETWEARSHDSHQ